MEKILVKIYLLELFGLLRLFGTQDIAPIHLGSPNGSIFAATFASSVPLMTCNFAFLQFSGSRLKLSTGAAKNSQGAN